MAYLDDNGNTIPEKSNSGAVQYLDENGNPVQLKDNSSPEKKESRRQVKELENERSQFEGDYTKEAQKPAYQKAFDIGVNTAKGIVNPVVAVAKAIPKTSELIDDPSKIIPTAEEGVRRLGMDVVDAAKGMSSLGAKAALPYLKGGGSLGMMLAAYNALKSKNPTQIEIQKAFEDLPQQQEVNKERNTSQFEGAVPEISEAGAQVAPFLIPGEGALAKLKPQSLKTASEVTTNAGRSFRAAMKPATAKFGNRLERDFAQEAPELYKANPEAHLEGEMPVEGVFKTVQKEKKAVESSLNELQGRSGKPFGFSDKMADLLEKKADDLERAAEPADVVEEVRSRAKDFRDKAQNLTEAQDSVRMANIRQSPSFRDANAASGLKKATANSVIDRVISEEGGNLINGEMERIGGAEGGELRSRWSRLKNIEDSLDKTFNKILNKTPPPTEAMPLIAEALSSPEGVLGAIGVIHGFGAGAIPMATSAAKIWAKRASKALKDPNNMVSKIWETLDKHADVIDRPPVLPGETVRPMSQSDILNQKIAESIQSGKTRKLPEGRIALEDMMGKGNIPERSVEGFEPPIMPKSNEKAARNNALNQAMVDLIERNSGRSVPKPSIPLEEAYVGGVNPIDLQREVTSLTPIESGANILEKNSPKTIEQALIEMLQRKSGKKVVGID